MALHFSLPPAYRASAICGRARRFRCSSFFLSPSSLLFLVSSVGFLFFSRGIWRFSRLAGWRCVDAWGLLVFWKPLEASCSLRSSFSFSFCLFFLSSLSFCTLVEEKKSSTQIQPDPPCVGLLLWSGPHPPSQPYPQYGVSRCFGCKSPPRVGKTWFVASLAAPKYYILIA